MRDFDRIAMTYWDDRQQSLEDRDFYTRAGAQWSGPLSLQFVNRPMLEFNKIAMSITRIVTEYRNNRITVKYRSKDDKQTEEADALANTCTDLYRADEQESTADEAYDNAFEEAVGGGMGGWELEPCYVDDESDDDTRQKIRIRPIFDADKSIYFDDNSRDQNHADAKYCFKIVAYTREAFKEAFRDDDPASWPGVTSAWWFGWYSAPDVVYVAVYWRVEETKETVNFYRLIGKDDEQKFTDAELDKNDGAKRAELEAMGARLLRQKKRTVRKVRRYVMSGSRILVDDGYIAGKNIPVVVVYGKRWWIENKERFQGHVRNAKDPQRLLNMQMSALAELSALSTRSKPIVAAEQIQGFELEWAEDNVVNRPVLRLNPLRNPSTGDIVSAGPIGMTQPPTIPPAMAALIPAVQQDMKDILGDQAQGDKIVSNVSEEVVAAAQMHIGGMTAIYLSNFAKGMQRSGVIYRDMMKDVYVEDDRVLKVVNEAGDASTVKLNQPALTDDGARYTENDLASIDFDVVVSVGPSSDSKRDATTRNLMKLMALTQDPEILNVLMSLAITQMDGELPDGAKDFFRQRMIKLGAVKPTEEEAAQLAQEQAAMANKPPDPQQQLLMSAAKKEDAQARKYEVDALATLASVEKTRADVELVHAKTVETIAKVDTETSRPPGPRPAPGERPS